MAQESQPAAASAEPPGKQKLSYALGMNLALQIKKSSVNADLDVVAQAIRDVLEGKRTEIQEPEIHPLLKQAEAFGRLKQISKNINEGAAFLAKNAKEPGITVLPDGLQYRVITTGTGEFPKPKDLLTLKIHGTWINGKEFRQNDNLEMPFLLCPKGLQEALQQMKVGSKWQIYVPYNLGYGRLKQRAVGFGSVLIYELELVSAELEGSSPNQHHGPGGRAGHSLDEDLLPPILRSAFRWSIICGLPAVNHNRRSNFMKLRLPNAVILAGLVAFSAVAEDAPEPPDEEKVSYALGMNLGLQIKRMDADADINVIIQAMKDVMEGKPTQIQASELHQIFQQEEAVQRALISKKNKAEGEAYLAKNAKIPGVTVLPDGLQYRIIKEGTGAAPTSNDNVTINFRGALINGKEIDHKDNFQVSVAGQLKGCQEALQLMKTGSKWQIFAPPALAFGSEWNGDVGPDTTVMFEIELISIQPSAHLEETSGGLIHQEPNAIKNNALPAAVGK